jgi:3-hydroxyacyl-CoA dehydrogenase
MKNINTVGIVGAGTMGSALAQKFAQEGFNVILADKELRFVENGFNRIKETLNEGVERKKFSLDQTKEIISRIKGSGRLIDLAKCELIIEAIFENIEAKTELLGNLSNIVNSEQFWQQILSFSVSELQNQYPPGGS